MIIGRIRGTYLYNRSIFILSSLSDSSNQHTIIFSVRDLNSPSCILRLQPVRSACPYGRRTPRRAITLSVSVPGSVKANQLPLFTSRSKRRLAFCPKSYSSLKSTRTGGTRVAQLIMEISAAVHHSPTLQSRCSRSSSSKQKQQSTRCMPHHD
jgi:hypothetical protein